MYCEKLMNILEHPDNKKYKLNRTHLIEISEFIRSRSKQERMKLDPVRTSMKLNLPLSKVLGFYIIGSYIKLFNINLIYRCDCGEKIKLRSRNQVVDCPECNSISNPDEYKDNTYMNFTLLEVPSVCKQLDYTFKNQYDEVDWDKVEGTTTLNVFDNTIEGGETESKKILESLLGGV